MSIEAINGQSGAGMLGDYMSRNRSAWLSVADFVIRQNLRAVLSAKAASGAAPGKRSAGAAPHGAALAVCPALPDGNHGENLKAPQA